MKRPYGSGHLYTKNGAYYGRWRRSDGRLVNRKIGRIRSRGEKDGITRAEAERGLRRLVEEDARRQQAVEELTPPTVEEVANELCKRIEIEGARSSYRWNCESMQRVHISPAMGSRQIDSITTRDVERLVGSMLARGLAPKTLRNVISFLYSVFALAVGRRWAPRTRHERWRVRSAAGRVTLTRTTSSSPSPSWTQ